MIAAPTPRSPETIGPLRAPDEQELAAAYAELRDGALTISWAADRLGVQARQLAVLVREGAVLAIPGPWAMRQAHGRLGCFVPAWQFSPGMERLRPELPALVAAAAAVGWTSLRLHRFMTTPTTASAETPAQLLERNELPGVLALMGDDERPHVPTRARSARGRASRRPAPPRARRTTLHRHVR
jgi:hypothetical protein